MTVRMPVLTVPDLPSAIPAAQASHASGGRDQWSPPMEETPGDLNAALRECLHEVLDPEIPISLIDLGLIYGAEMVDGVAKIDLTFTATACPCMEFIREDITDRLSRERWVDEVEIREVWDPPWTNERITERGRQTLRELGVGVAL